jgi:hypothetical protein
LYHAESSRSLHQRLRCKGFVGVEDVAMIVAELQSRPADGEALSALDSVRSEVQRLDGLEKRIWLKILDDGAVPARGE